MSCTVEFDLLETGFRHWWFVLSPGIFVVIGSGLLLWGNSARVRIFGFFFTLFGAVFLYGGFTGTYGDHKRFVNAYKSGDYSTVEGRIEEFREEGEGVRRRKYGKVGGQAFEISGAAYITIGYNERSNAGEPFSAGRYVKIWHIEGAIIRLESCASL